MLRYNSTKLIQISGYARDVLLSLKATVQGWVSARARSTRRSDDIENELQLSNDSRFALTTHTHKSHTRLWSQVLRSYSLLK